MNWCIWDEAQSLFYYEESVSFLDYDKCDKPYPEPPSFSTLSQEIIDVCGGNEGCLVGGLAGGIEDALGAIDNREEITNQARLEFSRRVRRKRRLRECCVWASVLRPI